MGVHLQKAESHGALVLEEPVSRTCNDPPPTKPILSYRFLQRLDRHTFGSKQLYLWLKSFQRKEKMTTLNRLLLKKAHRRLCSHVKQNQKDTCKISCEPSCFQEAVGRWIPRSDCGTPESAGLPGPQSWCLWHNTNCYLGSLGAERHHLHGKCSAHHLAQSEGTEVGYFVMGSKEMYKQEFFSHHEWLQPD